MVAVDATTRGQTVEVMSALSVSGRTQSKCTDRSRRHAVVVRLVGLHICPELELAMVRVVHGSAHNQCPRTQSVGDSSGSGKTVEPKTNIVNELDNGARWNSFEWKHGQHTSRAFLNDTDVSLDFRHMFFCCDSVKGDTDRREISSESVFVKLSIHEKSNNLETALGVGLVYTFDGIVESLDFLIGQKLRCTEFDVSRNRNKKWQLVHKHEITPKDHILVPGHNRVRYIGVFHLHVRWTLVDCFPFQ